MRRYSPCKRTRARPRSKHIDRIPRPSKAYQEYPFDPSLTICVNGRQTRYVNGPLDEVYVCEPGEAVECGGLPPEEREVRDHLLIAVILRKRVTKLHFWWSQFFSHTEPYKASLAAFQKLEALASSAEHRAALLRLSNSKDAVPAIIRGELKRMVARTDLHHRTGEPDTKNLSA